jgi:nitrate reductase NapAB chaperone NapD
MISSVVVRLSSPDYLEDILEVLGTRPEIETGQPSSDGCSLPVTIEAKDGAHMEQRKRWIEDLPGVEFVDVVCVYLDV